MFKLTPGGFVDDNIMDDEPPLTHTDNEDGTFTYPIFTVVYQYASWKNTRRIVTWDVWQALYQIASIYSLRRRFTILGIRFSLQTRPYPRRMFLLGERPDSIEEEFNAYH